jgi:hypothetical protein
MTKPTKGRDQYVVENGLEKESPRQRDREQKFGRVSGSEGVSPKDQQHPKTYARGGSGPTKKMFGKDDHTTTAPEDAAGPQTAGVTSSKSKGNPAFIKGGQKQQAVEEGEGKPQRVRVDGGLAFKAWPGSTGPRTDAVEEGEQHWQRGKRI